MRAFLGQDFRSKGRKTGKSKESVTLKVEIVVLAAGLGSRMKSTHPKVLHEVCGYPMLELLLRNLSQINSQINSQSNIDIERFNIVVGHSKEKVISFVENLVATDAIKKKVVYSVQEPQLGTGHAVRTALENTDRKPDLIAVLNGDLPLFDGGSFVSFMKAHLATKSSASLASMVLGDPGEYGRVIRKSGKFISVVESRDATPAQKKINEVNGGAYLFDQKFLTGALHGLKNKNSQNEFYLTDVFSFALKKKKKILSHLVQDPLVLTGVNDMKELAVAQKNLYMRLAEKWMTAGVAVHDPASTWIGPYVKIGKEVQIFPFVKIAGNSVIGDRVKIGSHVHLDDVQIGNDTLIRNSVYAEKTEIGEKCTLGPMAHFRAGTRIRNHVRIGNFVEIKESDIGSHTNAAHLSYIGDAQVGEHVNFGCGFITCNFDGTVKDGKRKHQTKIGNGVFIGSDSQLVAPIMIAEGTYIASGSTVTDSVQDPDSLVIARTKQVTKPGYAVKYRNTKKY